MEKTSKEFQKLRQKGFLFNGMALLLCSTVLLLTGCNTTDTSSSTLTWENALAPKGSDKGKQASLLDKNGAPQYRIVISKDADIQVKYAAEQLKARLDSFGHGEFSLITDEQAQESPELRVGNTNRSQDILPDVGYDGISIRACKDGSIELMGGEHRGTLNAVYSFLMEDLGYRYWGTDCPNDTILNEDGPAAEHIPEQLSFVPVTRSYTPQLFWRSPFLYSSFRTNFAVRNRTDSPDANFEYVPAEAGGPIYAPWGYIHTLPWLVDPNKLFNDHPDWYMMDATGKRINYNQLCETNSELAEYLIDYYMSRIEGLSQIPKLIGITKRDGGGVCHCPECTRVNQEEESDAGSLLTLINRVAEGIGEKYPQIRIMTFAYLETAKCPKHLKPAPNVSILYCNNKNAWSHFFVSARNEQAVIQDVSAWGAVAPMVIWDYSTNFDHYSLPMPNLGVIADNIRFWVENNAEGIMTQGAYQSYGSERENMRSWIIAQLLWNPNLDLDSLIKDFITGYFGKAAAPMLAYTKMLEDSRLKYADEMAEINIRYNSNVPFINDEFMSKAKELFSQAYELAGDDAVLISRIEHDELSILYTELLRQIEKGEAKEDFDATHAHFEKIARKINFKIVGEKAQASIDDFLAQRPVNKSNGQITFLDDDNNTVIRLDAKWRLKMLSESLQTIADATALSGENVDDSTWKFCNVNEGSGWCNQGMEYTIGTGIYRKELKIAPAKERKHWYIVLPGVDEEGWVYLNGKLVAEKSTAKTGMEAVTIWNYPIVQEITGDLRLGFATNTFAVKVFNISGIGGIYNGVYLVGSNEALTPRQAVDLLPEKPQWGFSSEFK